MPRRYSGVSSAAQAFLATVGLLLLSAGCAGPQRTPPAGPPTLAVWTVEDLSLPGTTPPELTELTTARITAAAEATGAVQLVERERLLAILQELSLGSSELADEATALRVGRLLGARQMLFGAYQRVGSQMRLDLRRVDVETGRILATAQKTVPAGNLAAWLDAAADAARDLLTTGT